jgi:hypothetical protein
MKADHIWEELYKAAVLDVSTYLPWLASVLLFVSVALSAVPLASAGESQ